MLEVADFDGVMDGSRVGASVSRAVAADSLLHWGREESRDQKLTQK